MQEWIYPLLAEDYMAVQSLRLAQLDASTGAYALASKDVYRMTFVPDDTGVMMQVGWG